MFIQVTKKDSICFINVKNICTVENWSGGGALIKMNDSNNVFCKESLEVVMEKINSVK